MSISRAKQVSEYRASLVNEVDPYVLKQISYLYDKGRLNNSSQFENHANNIISNMLYSYLDSEENMQLLKCYVAIGLDIDNLTIHGENVLELAYSKRCEEIFKIFLLSSIDLNKTNYYGETILFKAAQYNDLEGFKLMLVHGVNPNISSKACSLIEFISARGLSEFIEYLVENTEYRFDKQTILKCKELINFNQKSINTNSVIESKDRLNGLLARLESDEILEEIFITDDKAFCNRINKKRI